MSRPTEPIESRRYRLLLAQLREEFEERNGSDYGWKTEAAKRLGISQPFVTYLSAGEREASLESVKKASQLLRLRPEFFTDSTVTSPHYRDYIGPRPEHTETDAAYPEVEAYLSKLDEMGTPANPEDAKALLAMRFHDGARMLFSDEILAGFLRSIALKRVERERAAAHPKVPPAQQVEPRDGGKAREGMRRIELPKKR